MGNQNDNNFGDDNDLDDIFTSDDDPMNETGIQDAVESIDDISDYDDSEDGIFAPAPEKKKAGSSSVLLGTVAAVAVLAAGGFYVYKNPDLIASLTAGDGTSEMVPVAEVAPQEPPVEVAVQDTGAPAIVEIQPVQDAELTAIPQPQPIMNVEDTAGVPQAAIETPVSTPAPVEEQAVVPTPVEAPVATTEIPVEQATSDPVPAPDQIAVIEDVPAVAATTAPDLPPPPTPTETKAAIEPAPVVEEPVAPVVEAKSAPEPVAAVIAPPAKVPEIVTTPEPQQEVLAKAPVPETPKKSAASEKIEVTKPAKDPETVYFDAPKGSALTNIPTPSMNVKRGTNESIIIVNGKASKSTKAAKETNTATGAVTSTNQDSGVVAANRALRLGRYDAALDMYTALYQANPRDARILMGRAIALQKLGRSGEAINAYEEVIAIDDDNPEALVNLMGLVRKEYPALALEKLLNLRAKHPDNAGIAAQLGVAYADSGNLEDAAKYLMLASRAEPNNPQHYFNLGVVAERMKNRTRAIAYYEKALEIDAVYGTGRAINRDMIYDRLTRLRG